MGTAARLRVAQNPQLIFSLAKENDSGCSFGQGRRRTAQLLGRFSNGVWAFLLNFASVIVLMVKLL
jgi:hypothetical protein